MASLLGGATVGEFGLRAGCFSCGRPFAGALLTGVVLLRIWFSQAASAGSSCASTNAETLNSYVLWHRLGRGLHPKLGASGCLSWAEELAGAAKKEEIGFETPPPCSVLVASKIVSPSRGLSVSEPGGLESEKHCPKDEGEAHSGETLAAIIGIRVVSHSSDSPTTELGTGIANTGKGAMSMRCRYPNRVTPQQLMNLRSSSLSRAKALAKRKS